MTTAAVTQSESVEALAADARRRIQELAEARQRLASDAISDEDARQELANVESELAAADAELERMSLARAEGERRDVEARERAEAKRRAAALECARTLQSQREAAALKVDRGAKALAEALTELDRVCGEQAEQLRVVDLSLEGVRIAPLLLSVEGALLHAFHAARTPRGLVPSLNPNGKAGPSRRPTPNRSRRSDEGCCHRPAPPNSYDQQGGQRHG